MKILDLHASERPREKLLARGATALSDGELIAILLRTGTAGASVLDLAQSLVRRVDGHLIRFADLTLEDRAPDHAVFRSIERDQFAKRSTGALFAQGRYFSIRSGDLAGSYQISDDLVISEAFPDPRAYRKFLLGKK